jgi:hypothetical protein
MLYASCAVLALSVAVTAATIAGERRRASA